MRAILAASVTGRTRWPNTRPNVSSYTLCVMTAFVRPRTPPTGVVNVPTICAPSGITRITFPAVSRACTSFAARSLTPVALLTVTSSFVCPALSEASVGSSGLVALGSAA